MTLQSSNNDFVEFLTDYIKAQGVKIDSLVDKLERMGDKMEENHADVKEDLHNLHLKVTEHERNFALAKWAFAGGIAGMFTFFKGMLFPDVK